MIITTLVANKKIKVDSHLYTNFVVYIVYSRPISDVLDLIKGSSLLSLNGGDRQTWREWGKGNDR